MDNLQEPIRTEENTQEPVTEQVVTQQNDEVSLPQNDDLQNSSEVETEERVDTVDNTESEVNKPLEEHTQQEEIEIADDFFDHLNRQEVVETLEEVVGEKDIVKIKKQVSLLKIRFLQLNKESKEERLQSFLANGGNKEDYDYSADELEVRFEQAFDRYKANKAKYTEDLEQEKVLNLEKKYALLEELKVLIDSTDSLKQIHDKFKDIQTIWKEIGPVPQTNITELWQNYHFYVEKFFDKVKMNRELRDLDFKKNLERKLEICEKTEALMLESSILTAFNLLQQYHQEWREAGQIEEEKREELWNRFKTASDKINQQRKDYYDALDKQQEENYKAKLLLCDKIEEITQVEFTSKKQVSTIGDQVKVLLDAWKLLGAAPKEVHNEVWERFHKSLDTFFANKKHYMSQVKDDEDNNYNLKLNLCIQAEALASRTDWVKATKDVIELQEEWKKIGAVPRRHSETVWKRFRKACDVFFDAKKERYKEMNKDEKENLKKKEDIIKRVNEYVFAPSKEENFEVLKALQREWTEIGFTPIADRDRVWNAFREAINKRFDELKLLPNSELDKAKYTERIQEILDNKNTKTTIGKEQWNIQSKIKELTDDVNLWENNLGFFANSKNSDELRAQFNKKIEQAKQEINTLKTKLAIIKESRGNK